MKNNKSNKIEISAIVLVGGNYDKKLLEKCLKSIDWCDEVIKVETAGIKGSFSEWRNQGANQAKGNWLFYVDSDEEVTDALKDNINKILDAGEFAGYSIPRRNIFLGHEMHFGGWYPDYVLRLIRKDKLKGWFGELHEQPLVDGNIGHLKEPFIHRTHRNLHDMVEKTNKWSDIEAKLLYEAGHPKMNILRFFSVALREFWYRGIMKLGFLDGTVGVIEIVYQMYSRLITYSKLWEMQLKLK